MKPIVEKANYADLEEILALQKAAFHRTTFIYDDVNLPPLVETLTDIQHDFLNKTMLKIVLDSKIVGSVRGSMEGKAGHIERLSVHPDYQKHGLGFLLMTAIENYFSEAEFYKLYTGIKSLDNINWYQKLGYKIIGEKTYSAKLTLVFMIKNVRNSLKIKVCGMRDAENIRQLIQLPIDYMGFIFYEKSARYVVEMPEIIHSDVFNSIKKVGVFVDADIDFMLKKIAAFELKIVQLHGKETPQYIDELKIKNSKLMTHNSLKNSSLNVDIWKAFPVDDTFDFNETKPYEGIADKFLFDTKTPLHGGSGQKFNWDILNQYTGRTPFFLSGGISASDTEGVKKIEHPQFYGVDINSKFEISPALKDVPLLQKFIEDIRI